MALPTTLTPSGKSNSTGAGVSPAEPTGVANGDLELLVASTIAGATISITANGGGAWTALGTGHQDVASGEHLYVWYRIRQAGDSAPTVTPSADHICATMWGYHSVDQGTPVEAIAWSSETTSDTSYSYNPGNSTTVNDCVVCTVYSSGVDSNTGQGGTVFANASLTNVALLAEYETTSGLGGGFVILEGDKATAGTTGTWSDTMVSATPKSYVSFAVRPVQPIIYTDSDTVPVITSPSSAELQAHDYLDNATVTSVTDPTSAADIYTPAGTQYTESATVTSVTSVSVVETSDKVDSATISGVSTLTVTEVSDKVDTATVSGTSYLTTVEVYDALDSATVSGVSNVSSGEIYTPAAVTQKAYPISDVTSTGWTASAGAVPLYTMIDEPDTPDDGDYIYATAS